MVVTATYYQQTEFNRLAPLIQAQDTLSSMIRVNFRILTRRGEIVIDFGQFKNLLAYNDNLSVRGGNFTITMAALPTNEQLMRSVHPGMVVEFYACRNDDPLLNTSRDNITPPKGTQWYQNDRRAIDLIDRKASGGEQTEISSDWTIPQQGEQPQDYLDKSPYLLLRGIIGQHGINTGLQGTTITISGDDYGSLYRKSPVLTDRSSPLNVGAFVQTRNELVLTQNLPNLYYRILRDFVEGFWGLDYFDTGWITRTRPLRTYPYLFARMPGQGESALEALKSLIPDGFFELFSDHTGALCWEKLPYSSTESPRRIERYLTDLKVENWEDTALVEIPKWKIEQFMERIGTGEVANYLTVRWGNQAGASGSGKVEAARIINLASIAQYGLRRSEVSFPLQLGARSNKEERKKINLSLYEIASLFALEGVTWRDRPIAQAVCQCRGEPYYRLYNRVRIKGKEYLISKRSHTIDLQNGSWKTQLDLEGDRRDRYLGIGDSEDDLFQGDRYLFFDINTEGEVNRGKYINLNPPPPPDEEEEESEENQEQVFGGLTINDKFEQILENG